MKRSRRWRGTTPVQCDVCHRRFDLSRDTTFYDFKTRAGPWAIGCTSCFTKEGDGLGVGLGQKYNLRTLGREDD